MIENVDITPSDWIPETDSIIKVLGVGGGGCNAVNYMYSQRIEGCTFIVCNTDSQALDKCDVPIKIQLGEGLGAGTNPTEGRNAALNSQDEIAEKVLGGNTEMLFITAGMGGGTGTGAGELADAIVALDWLQNIDTDANQCWIAGYSFGSWIAAQVLMRRPEIQGFVFATPPTNLYEFNFLL